MNIFLTAFSFLTIINLSFVSICTAQTKSKAAKSSTIDEFKDFEQELDLNTTQSRPPESPAPLAGQQSTTNSMNNESLVDKISRLKNEIRKEPNSYSKIVELAMALSENKDPKSATVLLWKHIEKINRSGIIHLAKTHILTKEYSEAIKALNLLISKNEKDFEAHSLTGDSYRLQNKKDLALESYEMAIKLRPNYEPAYNGLINLYENMTPPNLYELRILYQDMIKSIGKRSEFYQKVCEINFLDAVHENAIRTCRDAIRVNSSVPDAHVYYAVSLNNSDQTEKGTASLKKTAERFPQSEVAQFYYASLLETNKNYIEAYKFFKQGTAANPSASRSWLGYATTSFELKKYSESLEAYRKACQLDNKNAPLFRKAASILRLNRNSEWQNKFENASEGCGR